MCAPISNPPMRPLYAMSKDSVFASGSSTKAPDPEALENVGGTICPPFMLAVRGTGRSTLEGDQERSKGTERSVSRSFIGGPFCSPVHPVHGWGPERPGVPASYTRGRSARGPSGSNRSCGGIVLLRYLVGPANAEKR